MQNYTTGNNTSVTDGFPPRPHVPTRHFNENELCRRNELENGNQTTISKHCCKFVQVRVAPIIKFYAGIQEMGELMVMTGWRTGCAVVWRESCKNVRY